jgi:SET domain-containing protein
MARSSRKKSAKKRRDSDVSPLVYVAKSKLHGYGLFAAVDIPADLVLGRLVGMPTREDDEYVLWIEDDLGLELVNDLRFINHGRPANVAFSDVDAVILRDIAAGEELLHDYGW